VDAKLHMAHGLAALAECHYDLAARELLAVRLEHCEPVAAIIHGDEIALCALVCALATYSRDELRTQVLESPSAKLALELAPALRGAIAAFVASKYAACLEALHALKVRAVLRGLVVCVPAPVLRVGCADEGRMRCPACACVLQAEQLDLELVLAPHTERLVTRIRQRALTQYLTPYTTVDLRTMAEAFVLP